MDRNLVGTFTHPETSPGQARKSLWIETQRVTVERYGAEGQARKSLWIETIQGCIQICPLQGQARKSLWIETGKKQAYQERVERSGS